MSTLRRGMRGPEVRAWQGVLSRDPLPQYPWRNSTGFDHTWPGHWAWPPPPDGDFGERTQLATEHWQSRRGLYVDGVVGPITQARARMKDAQVSDTEPPPPIVHPNGKDLLEAGRLPLKPAFVPAKHFKWLNRTGVDLLVIHSAETSELPSSAEAVAAYFKDPRRLNAKTGMWEPVIASCHYSVDSDSVVQSVEERHSAAHCGKGNTRSIGIEHAGRARQTNAEWLDEYGKKMLALSARLAAGICHRWSIPVRRPAGAELKAGARGICGHVDMRDAFGGTVHYDPGPAYPWDMYLASVEAELATL